MSTFLQLVNRLASECGATSASSAVAAVTGNTGDALRFCNWTISAHNEIQRRHTNWRWMRSKWTVNTVASDDTYAPTDCTDSRLSATISRFARWIPLDDNDVSNVLCYLTSGGVASQVWLIFLPWASFNTLYKRGTQTPGQPVHFTIDPQNNTVLGPKPSDIYTLSGEYQMSAQVLAADGDTPEFPEDFHDVIWCRALEKYGAHKAAPEALARALSDGKRLMRQLEADQLPAFGFARPLV